MPALAEGHLEVRAFEEDLAASLAELSKERGSEPVPGAEVALRKFGRLLFERSAKMSLVSTSDRPCLGSRHLLPSALLAMGLQAMARDRIMDLGSGNGIPGVVLAALLPGSSLTLVEARRRRAHFLKEALRTVAFGAGHRVVSKRLTSDSGAESWGRFDLAVARAVGPAEEVELLAGPHLEPWGALVLVRPRAKAKALTSSIATWRIAWSGGCWQVDVIPAARAGAG